MNTSLTLTKSMRVILPSLFILALCLRLAGIYIETTLHLGGHVAERYTAIARNIVMGNGYIGILGSPDIFEPPIYPYFISIIFSIFGENVTAVKVFQAIIDSFNLVVIFFIAKAVFNINSAFWAAMIYSVYPIAVYSVADVGPETVFGLLLNVSLLTLILGLRLNKMRYFITSGLLFGAATLTRATTLLYLPFLTLCLLLLIRSEGRNLIRPVLALWVAFVVVILPWTARNYLVSNRFIPVAVAGYGEVFLQGSSEEFLIIKDKEKNFPLFFSQLKAKGIELPPHATPKDFNDFALRAGWEKYKERWQSDGFLGFSKFISYKFSRLWYSTESGTNHAKILLINMLILPLAIAGITLSIKWKISTILQLPIYALLLYFTILHTVTLPLHRYVVPIMPFLIIYEAFFLSWIARNRELPVN